VISQADPFGLIGTTLADKYRIDRLLGEGGFGVVYAGHHLLLGQPIALKCMKPSSGNVAEQQRVTDLFLREARVLFSLTHPNIVRMYDVGTLPMSAPLPNGAWASSVPYVVLELIDGRSLQDEIGQRRARGGPHFGAAELSSLFRQILEGVGFAHENGVVHRDLKPSNVMLVGSGSSWVIKVVDFGIARVAASAETTTGAPFTPLYAAPEQWDASLGSVGPATDLFAVGLMFVEACTLTKALPSDSLAQVVGAVMDPNRRTRVGVTRPDLSTSLDEIVAWATRVRPHDRAPSARSLQQSLVAALGTAGGRGTQPIPVVPSVPPGQPVSPMGPVPPQAPSQPQAAMFQTTPATVAMTNPALSQTPPSQVATIQPAPKQGWSVGKMILGVTGILSVTVLLGLTIVMVFAYRACVDQPWMQPPDPAAAAAPEPTTTAAPRPIPPTNGWLYLQSIQPGHFWTEHQLRIAIEPEVAGFESCYEKHIPKQKRFDGFIALTLHPTTTGRVSQVSCSAIAGGKNLQEHELCNCISSKASALIVPKPTGKLGLLRTAPFIVSLGTRKTQRKPGE